MSFCEELMNPIEIKNKKLLDILKVGEEIIKEEDFKVGFELGKEQEAKNWVSKEYLDYIMDIGDKHDGYPKSSKMYGLAKLDYSKVDNFNKKSFDKIDKFKNDLCAFTGVHHNALFSVYPPGGYISWHNNQNAPGYNVLFTWSENGDGYWEHYDPIKQEIVRINDVPGWQCKYGYYGSYEEGPEKVLYHTAATNCWRITIAYVFNANDTGKMMSELMVEDISSE